MTPRFVLAALRRWWKVALPVALLLAAAGGTTVYLLFEPVYEAAAWFKIEERTPYLAFESKDEGRSKLFFQTQIETIRSPLVLGPVIKRPEIASVPEIARQADKVAWLAKQIKVASVGESELFRISVRGPDPKDAADVVNAVTESYFKLRDQSDTERNQRIIDLLSQEKDKRSKEVMRLRDNLRTLAKQATGKDPFRGQDGGGLAAEASAGRPGEPADRRRRSSGPCWRRGSRRPRRNWPRSGRKGACRRSEASRCRSRRSPCATRWPTRSSKRAPKSSGRRRSSPPSGRADRDRARCGQGQAVAGPRPSGGRDPQRRARRSTIAGGDEAAGATRGGIGDAWPSGPRRERRRSQRRMEELAKMRSDRGSLPRDGEDAQGALRRSNGRTSEQSSGDTMELGFKRDELARAEKVFELIAQRAVQLQTERARAGPGHADAGGGAAQHARSKCSPTGTWPWSCWPVCACRSRWRCFGSGWSGG